MTMSNQLNLTRKWRSQNFEEIVGQDLVVRVLKNSMYRNHFFPVYLFSGQRGCGKTSVARIFAAALNCELLETFQKAPREHQIPCGLCRSCLAMLQQQHPDFIEIDAASYTGVDNIRNIIETASFLPVLGRKKVYLIDEVHMLSKAAFNALLKILEEPPAQVLFILATTEISKIIDTVQSRAFKIFFQSVTSETVFAHLKAICDTESIAYEVDGLQLIAQESDGSVRDAINLLERARFAYPKVTKQSITELLGHVDQAVLYLLAQALLSKNVVAVLELFQGISKQNYSAVSLSHQLEQLWYDLILLKHEIRPQMYLDISKDLQDLLAKTPSNRLLQMFEYILHAEQTMSKLHRKEAFLEMNLVRLASLGEHREQEQIINPTITLESKKKNIIDEWNNILEEMKQTLDPMIYSVFKEAEIQDEQGLITIKTFKKFLFFEDVVNEYRVVWMKILKKYSDFDQLQLVFNLEQIEPRQVERVFKQITVPEIHQSSGTSKYKKLSSEEIKDLKITAALLSHFDGDVYNITMAGKS
jgi:DNA polymerase-3 subunit gamma/tau